MATLRKYAGMLALGLAVAGNCRMAIADGAVPSEIPVVETEAASGAYVKKSLAAGRCWVADVTKGDGGVLSQGNSETLVQPGRYRLHAQFAVAPLGDLHMGALSVDLTAGGQAKSFGVLNFAVSDEFTDCTVDFTSAGGQCSYALNWSRSGLQAHKNNVQTTDLTAIDPDKDNDVGDMGGGEGPATAQDGTIAVADLNKIKYRVAFTGLHIEKLSPVGVDAVATDKIVYKPGDAGSAAVTLHNYSDQAQSAHVVVSLNSGLATSHALHDETIQLAPGASKDLTVPFTTGDIYWGCGLAATVSTAAGSDTKSDTFAVCRNFWETAICNGMNYSQPYADPKEAEAKMQGWRDDGYTVFESGFWAPDEFGDFTPEKDWLSGQCEYRGSVIGTKNMINAGHRRGISATVYSNLWGGDGLPAFEMMRAHPDWVGTAEFGTDWLDMWTMGRAGKIAISELWPFTCISDDGTKGALVQHANEFIKSHSMYGWDGTRYDSYGSSDWTKMATPKVRAIVEKAVPDYRWGYNTNVPQDEKDGAIDGMIGGGGLEMEESIRAIGKATASFAHYADVVTTYRDIIWPHGGHFGVCYDKPKDQVLDELYLSSFLLASGTHPYYSTLENTIGNYNRFGLRYSEFIWNNKMRPVKNPTAVVEFEGDPHLTEWKRLVRRLDLGGNNHRLIVHLINAPVDDASLHNYGYKTPAPLRDFPVAINLPAGAHVTSVYDLSPISEPNQRSLAFDAAGTKLKFKEPQVRIWDAIVIDYTAAEGIQ